jgi:serine/threonine protein kinase
MCGVYKARDTRPGRVAAIKISGEKLSELFEREARAVSALNNPNIQLYDVGPHDLVMEYVDGRFLVNTVLDSAATPLTLLQH